MASTKTTPLKIQSEADVQRIVANAFGSSVKLNVTCGAGAIDILTDNILVEVKFQKPLDEKVLAQALHYCHNLYTTGRAIPSYIVLANETNYIVYDSIKLDTYYLTDSYFENTSPSGKHDKLEQILKSATNPISTLLSGYTTTNITPNLKSLADLNTIKTIVSTSITNHNVGAIFDDWHILVNKYLDTTAEKNELFVFTEDAQNKGKMHTYPPYIDIEFNLNSVLAKIEQLDEIDYDSFWKVWQKLSSHTQPAQLSAIFGALYGLMPKYNRRQKGQFYTPKHLAEEGWRRLEAQLGKEFWMDGSWRIWDCAAGTGQLEYDVVPASAHKYMYLSTIDPGEVMWLNTMFPQARGIFQFDFLNTVQYSAIANTQFQSDLKNPKIKWLFFINPPYKEAGNATSTTDDTAPGVADTYIKVCMKKEKGSGYGKASNELTAQFLYRIWRDFSDKAYMGVFCKAKTFISQGNAEFRNKFFKPKFDGGYVIKADDHFECNGAFPILFSLLDLRDHSKSLDKQSLKYDVYDKGFDKVGEKIFIPFNPQRVFRKHFLKTTKEPLTVETPRLGSALSITKGSNKVGYAPKEFIGSVAFQGIDFQRQRYTCLLSGLHIHNDTYITSMNYREVLTGTALSVSVKYEWLRDLDIFMSPKRSMTETEIEDCVLYALVCNQNNCSTTTIATHGFAVSNHLNPLGTIKVETKVIQMNAFNETKNKNNIIPIIDIHKLSDIGLKCYNEMKCYINEVMAKPALHNKPFLGLYQYRNGDPNFSPAVPPTPYPKSFTESIETLRQRVSVLAEKLCLS